MLKPVVIFSTFVRIVIHFFHDSLMKRKSERTAFILKYFFVIWFFCYIYNVFIFTFEQYNASLLGKSINLFVLLSYWQRTFQQ